MNAVTALAKDAAAGALQRDAATRLRAAGIENAELDARVLIAHAMGIEPENMLARPEIKADAAAVARCEEFVRRRIAGEPVARILGFKEFWSHRLVVGPDVLVPRPDTETLVEAALQARPARDAALRVLDLGTGSGALLAAILLERPLAFGVGIDRSIGALKIARANFETLGLSSRTRLVCGDWGAMLHARFDVIVSNPPYIASHEIDALPCDVREHDPHSALDGGSDGLDAYRAICSDLQRLLAPDGVAVLELGLGQEQGVAAIARTAQLSINGPAHFDLAGRARALIVTPAGAKKTLGSDRNSH